MFASFSRGSPGTPPTAPSRIASCALDGVEVGVGQRVAGLEEAGGTQREARLVEADAAARGRGIEHLLGFGDDLRTDAVTGDDGELHDAGHPAPSQRSWAGAGGGHAQPPGHLARVSARRVGRRASAERERGDHGGDHDQPGADERGDTDPGVEGMGRGIPQRLPEGLVETVRGCDGAGEGLAGRLRLPRPGAPPAARGSHGRTPRGCRP